MTKQSFIAIGFLLWLIALSLLHFLTLVLALPFWFLIGSVALCTCGIVVLGRYVSKQLCLETSPVQGVDWYKYLAYIAGLAWIIYKTYTVQDKYGHWDAWWFWNVRADFLTHPECWKNAFAGDLGGGIFTVPVAHADYPPFVPLVVSVLWRFIGEQSPLVPYTLSMVVALIIPSLIYWEIYPRNKVVAVFVLLAFATNNSWAKLNAAQTADNWIAVFFLVSLLLMHAYHASKQEMHLVLLGVILGSLLWIKNEGMILAAVFILFYLKTLFAKGNWQRVLCGLLIPFAAFAYFKLAIAPANDIIVNSQGSIFNKISDGSRYEVIRQIAWDIFTNYYPVVPYLVGGYGIFCLIEKRMPSKMFWLVLSSFLCYMAVYVVTPHDLSWHVSTSLDRLIIQLLPGLIWIIAFRLSEVEFRIARNTKAIM